MSALAKAIAVLLAAVACAAVFGVGVPVGWVWVASHVQSTVGQGTSDLAALIVIAGPLATYIALIVVAGRLTEPKDAPPQRMPWNRSRDDTSESPQRTTAVEHVVLLAIFMVGAGFEVWFFFFAHQRPWGSN